MENFKTRKFSGITYIDPGLFDCWVRSRFDDGFLEYGAYIVHDSDVWTEYDFSENPSDELNHSLGDKKASHLHFLLICHSPSSPGTIINHLVRWQLLNGITSTQVQNTLCEFCTSPDKMLQYFTHNGEPWKHQYSTLDIVSYGSGAFISNSDRITTKKDSIQVGDVINDMADGLTCLQLVQKYGNFFMRNYRSIMALYAQLQYMDNFPPWGCGC